MLPEQAAHLRPRLVQVAEAQASGESELGVIVVVVNALDLKGGHRHVGGTSIKFSPREHEHGPPTGGPYNAENKHVVGARLGAPVPHAAAVRGSPGFHRWTARPVVWLAQAFRTILSP